MSTGALIGRDLELAELEIRARHHRLVTIIGPGGVGKTALANEIAGRVGGSFPMGVRHVDLTRIDDVGAVPGTLAAQLGFDSFDALLSSPADRPVLLVIDNCEHLLEATAASIVQVLGACQQPTILATSRSPLELPGESVVSLAPLGVPAEGDDPTACPSVQLFLERCRNAGATVNATDLPQVAELCRRLDGLPLAIEIAAARARTMTIGDIGARLADGVDVLDRPRFRGAPRHRGVSDTIRWSYDLLEPGPRELFEQLAVFAGSFPAPIARAVTLPSDRHQFDARLDELVNASLVSVDTSGPETRYRLLETVRRFASDQLGRRGELDAAYDRFVDHVISSSLEVLAGATTSWRPDLLRDLVGSYDNVAEALRWCNRHDSEPRRAHTLCSIFWTLVHQGHAEDVAVLVRATLDRWPDHRSAAAAQAAAALATAEYVTGNPQLAVELAERTLADLAKPGLPTITLLRVLGQARRVLGDTPGALEAFRRGAAAGHELRMSAMALELEVAAAQVLADAGDVEAAMDSLPSVIDRAIGLNSAISESWARTTLAWIQLRVDPIVARPLIDSALSQARALEYPVAIAVNLRSRAFAQLLTDELDAAVATITELLNDLLTRGALSNARVLVDVTAALAYRAGHPSWEKLAATARGMPISTMASAAFELIPLPPTSCGPMARHDAINAVNHLLAELAAGGVAAEPSTSTAAEPSAQASISRRGDICELHFRGRRITVRTSKGVNDLIQLIDADGREIHCLDLVGAGVEQSSTGEVIDAEARQKYEQRIRDLQADIDEAEHDNDHGRAYRAQVELDTLIDHLTAALGHGGRTRRAADNAERARSAVTHRVRSTIRQLDKLNPVLGKHLSGAITTGTYCSYRPEQPTDWTID